MVIFTFFHDYEEIAQNTTFPKIPKIAKIRVYPKNGQNWEILENGLFGGIPKNGQNQGIPQNAQNGQKWGFWEIPQKWCFRCGGDKLTPHV